MGSSDGADWRPRLVALDVDGTVVDRNGALPGDVRADGRPVRQAEQVDQVAGAVPAPAGGQHDGHPGRDHGRDGVLDVAG